MAGGFFDFDSRGASVRGYASGAPSRGNLILANASTLNWYTGLFFDTTITVTSSSILEVSDRSSARGYRYFVGSDININAGSKLDWLSGDVPCGMPTKNSNIYIANGATFTIISTGFWGMSANDAPAPAANPYFAVQNQGLVFLYAQGTATIVGNYFNMGSTILTQGILCIEGLAEQEQNASALFQLQGRTTVKVGGPETALRIKTGRIEGDGTVDANLTIGYDPEVGPIQPTNATISPGIAGTNSGIGTIDVNGRFQIFAPASSGGGSPVTNGAMVIDITSTGNYDRVIVHGTYAALGGSLTINNQGYYPAQLVSLSFLTAASIVSDFNYFGYNATPWAVTGSKGMEMHKWKHQRNATSYSFDAVMVNP